MTEIVYEVVMKNGNRITNCYFQTIQAAYEMYHEYESANWIGNVYRREIDY